MRERTLSVVMVVAFLCWGLLEPAHAQRRGEPVQLPAGAGQELVQTACARCHRLNLITNYWGNTEEGWRELFSSMIDLPADQSDVVAGYLATHFPVQPAPEAVVIPGTTRVSIREWLLPSLGSRPHDPLAAADGAVVDRAVVQRAGTARSGDGRHEGVSSAP